MKIAYILDTFPSLSETFILREILALREMGLKMEIFSLRKPALKKVHRQAEPLIKEVHYRPSLFSGRVLSSQAYFLMRDPLRYIGLLIAITFRNLTNPLTLVKILRNFPAAPYFALEAKREGVTHVHAHFAYIPADVGMIMAKLLKVRFSLTAHAWDIYTQKRNLSRRMQAAAFVATCTDYNRDYLMRLYPQLPGEKIVAIHHGLDIDQFQRVGEERRDKNLILGVGRLEEKKGFIYLVEACRLLKEKNLKFRCEIVGEGPERKKLEELIEKYSLAGEVFLRGELTHEELIPLYGKASILVHPAIITAKGDRDGLPNVLLEALAMEVPVVASRISAIPEAIEDGETGLLTAPGDEKELADRIAKLLEDAGLREKLAARGKAKVSQEFDIRKNTGKLAQLFPQ